MKTTSSQSQLRSSPAQPLSSSSCRAQWMRMAMRSGPTCKGLQTSTATRLNENLKGGEEETYFRNFDSSCVGEVWAVEEVPLNCTPLQQRVVVGNCTESEVPPADGTSKK